MQCSDKFYLGRDWYPYYASLPKDKAGPTAYHSGGAVSSCEQKCEQYANSVDFADSGFYCLNQCLTQCDDLSRQKVRYGGRDADL